jgi:hypothetical protein
LVTSFSPWAELYWYVSERLSGLGGCFESIFELGGRESEYQNDMARAAFLSIRSQVAELQHHSCISTIQHLVCPYLVMLICKDKWPSISRLYLLQIRGPFLAVP